MKTSLYIHIPYCVSKCDYCDFFSIGCGKKQVPQDYVEALCNEILWKIQENAVEKWNTVFIGGGTPSLLNKAQLHQIFSSILSVTDKEIKECTIEVNPDDITRDFIQILSELPVTRISCGIQSLDQAVLKDVNRRSSLEKVLEALECISENWKKDFSTDVISGLPEQTEEGFICGLKRLMEFKPDHISMYSLTIEEGTPLCKRIEEGKLDYDYEKADSMWLSGREFLKENGYFQYEVSNFSKPGKECLHNIVYWQLKDYIGCGAGATGTIYRNRERLTNKINLAEYIDFWQNKFNFSNIMSAPIEREELDSETLKFEFLMMGLRTLKGISSQDYESRFKEKLPQEIISRFQQWQKKDLAVCRSEQRDTTYALTESGILFLNKFLTE